MAEEWQDPFERDERALERERRRRERRERRGGRSGDGGSQDPWQRIRWDRVLLAIGGLVALVLIGIGASQVISRLGEDEPPPPPETKTVDVTLAEGHDRAEVAELLEDQGFSGDYMKETESFPGFDPGRYDAGDPPSLEGFLFPETYELRRPPTVKALVKRQLATFEDRIKRVDMGYAESKNLNTYDVLTIASMVEKEVSVEGERRLVAAVIYNRLSAGMPLGIDATIRYITGNKDEPLTVSELAIDSPYNTREVAGLPPTPIASPGLASIQAAAHPARVDYLYYVVKPGTCPPKHFFTASQAEFDAAVARYNAAREAAGGKSPTC